LKGASLKILIFGQPSNNRGDEAAGRAMIYGILDKIPNAEIFVYYCDENLIPVVLDHKQVCNIFRKEKGAGSFILSLFAQLLLNKFGIIINKEAKELIELIKKMDIVCLSPSGPLIGDMYNFRSEFIRLAALFIAQRFGKKTMIYGPSMGPFRLNTVRHYIRKQILNHTDMITVRDEISYGYLKKANLVSNNVLCTLDSAIQREISVKESKEYYSKIGVNPGLDIMIGVTPISLAWHPIYGKMKNIKAFDENNLTEMCKAMMIIKNKIKCKYIFFPQLFGADDDMPVINSLISMFGDNDSCVVLPSTFDSDIQQAMISSLRLFIGMRYHSIIFSAKMGVPFVGVTYEHKTEAFIQHIDMQDCMIKVDNLTSSEISSKAFDVLFRYDEFKHKLENINLSIKKESYENTRLLLTLSP